VEWLVPDHPERAIRLFRDKATMWHKSLSMMEMRHAEY